MERSEQQARPVTSARDQCSGSAGATAHRSLVWFAKFVWGLTETIEPVLLLYYHLTDLTDKKQRSDSRSSAPKLNTNQTQKTWILMGSVPFFLTTIELDIVYWIFKQNS